MFELEYVIFSILLLLAIGVVIAIGYTVVRNRQTRRAIVYARRILSGGGADSEEQFRSIYRRLATTRHDLEAEKLWKQLDELRDRRRPGR
jgi:hypothetical protein